MVEAAMKSPMRGKYDESVWSDTNITNLRTFLAFEDFGHWELVGYCFGQDWTFYTKEDQESLSMAGVNEAEQDGGGKNTGAEAYGPGLYFQIFHKLTLWLGWMNELFWISGLSKEYFLKNSSEIPYL